MYTICPGPGFADAATILGADVDGVLMRDGWAPYRRFTDALHQSLLARLGRLIDTAPVLPEARRFAAHLTTEFPAVFAFLWAPEVDATNWRAEHAIWPAVVNRKVCGGNRTPRGAQTQQILASVVRTARQRLVDLTDFFTTVLRRPRPTVPRALPAPPQ